MHRRREGICKIGGLGAGVLASMIMTSHAAAGIWLELGDAGQNGPAQAQVTIGAGSLELIQGIIDDGNDADVYLIQITDEANFSAMAQGPLDTMLFLFRADGLGQVMNDDFNLFNAGLTSQGVFSNGLYYLAISRFNNQPQDAANNHSFGAALWPGPDPQQFQANAAAGAFDHWTGSGGDGGGYQIALTGAAFAPAPGGLALLSSGALLGARRRRR